VVSLRKEFYVSRITLMIHFFVNPKNTVYGVQTESALTAEDILKLNWLFGHATKIDGDAVAGDFVSPHASMAERWSTNAVEITQNMGVEGIIRIEEYTPVASVFTDFDPMISQKFAGLTQELYTNDISPEPSTEIDDIDAYNKQEGL